MWDANSNDGVKQAPKPGWQSGLEQFKIKVPISDFLNEIVEEHMWDEHEEWANSHHNLNITTKEEVYIYCNVNTVTGEITLVGAGGHPLDLSKHLK